MSVAKSHLVAAAAALGNAYTGECRLAARDAAARIPAQPCTRCPCSLFIHASLEIIIIITCVSAGFHRPKNSKPKKEKQKNRIKQTLGKQRIIFHFIVWPCSSRHVSHRRHLYVRVRVCVCECACLCVGVRVYNYPTLIIFK